MAMKLMLYGENDNEPNPEIVSQLAQEIYTMDILQLLVQNISRFEFEVVSVQDCAIL